MARILVAETLSATPDIRATCRRLGHETRVVGIDARAKTHDGWAQLIVLDGDEHRLPASVDLCRTVRSDPATADTPLVAVTAPEHHAAEAHLHAAGVSAFLRVRGHSTETMDAQLEAILRRCGLTPRTQRCVSVGHLVLDLELGDVHLGNLRVHLTRSETDLLHTLIIHRGQTVPREQLLRRDGQTLPKGSRTVDMHVKQLRRKLAAYGAAIQTKYGVGYRLDTSVFNTSPVAA